MAHVLRIGSWHTLRYSQKMRRNKDGIYASLVHHPSDPADRFSDSCIDLLTLSLT